MSDKHSGMKNFLRGLRFASPYWRRLVVSVICAGLAALFWSLSFPAAYPVLKILGTDKNLQEWVNDKIQETSARVEPLQKEVDDLKAKREEIEGKRQGRSNTTRIRNERALLVSRRQALHRHAPADRPLPHPGAGHGAGRDGHHA
jgi:ATP-binding cassette, subfamily B, bacterial MsbA